MGDTFSYDALSRAVFGTFFKGIAADVAAVTPPGGRVLDVGCGPGLLSIRLADEQGLDATGVDLDPDMIARAQANAERWNADGGRRPRFLVGDVAALPFSDDAFDLVVSTLSMHHWADVPEGLAEIARVLRPTGRALIWDVRQGVPLHVHTPNPLDQVAGGPLRVASAGRWQWPWRFAFTQRLELVPADH